MGFLSNIPYVRTEQYPERSIYFNNGWLPERISLETILLNRDYETTLDCVSSWSILNVPPGDEFVIVRNRIARPFWWAVIRIRETLRTTKGFIIRVFGIWELANTPYALEYRWRDIRPIGWIGKKVGLWD